MGDFLLFPIIIAWVCIAVILPSLLEHYADKARVAEWNAAHPEHLLSEENLS